MTITTDIAIRLEARLNIIEKKLDAHLEKVTKHEADLKWVQGYIKVSLVALITIGGAIATTLFKIL